MNDMKSIGAGPPHGLDSGSLAGTRWDDKSFPATFTKRGANDKPDFDFTNVGLLFPQNDPSEKVYGNDQMLHAKKLGTALRLHVHFVQDSASLPIFKLDYRYHNNGIAIPSFTTIATVDGIAFEYPGFPIIQIISFPYISAPSGETLSANFDLIFYRDDNVVSGDVLVKFLDYHFESDSGGSRQEFIK